MKKYLFISLLFLCFGFANLNAQQNQQIADKEKVTSSGGVVYIPDALARSYVSRYISKRRKRVNKKFLNIFGGQLDALNIWFDISKIKDIINDAETEAKASGRTLSGLRFYYGVYPKDKPENPLRHSLIIVPTELIKDDTVHYDIARTYKGKSYLIYSGVMAANNGTLCPPLPPASCKGSALLNPESAFTSPELILKKN